MAQPGRAFAWGARGRWFESSRPEIFSHFFFSFLLVFVSVPCFDEGVLRQLSIFFLSSFLSVSFLSVPLAMGDSPEEPLPPLSDRVGFCKIVVREFAGHFSRRGADGQTQSVSDTDLALISLVERLKSRLDEAGESSEVSFSDFSSLDLAALQELTRAISGGELNLKDAVEAGFRKLRQRIGLSIRELEFEKVHLLKMGVRAYSLLPLQNRIDDLRKIEMRIIRLSPDELASLFLQGLGVAEVLSSAAASSKDSSKLSDWQAGQLRYYQTVQAMVNHLRTQLLNDPKIGARLQAIQAQIKAAKLSLVIDDFLLIGDLYRRHLLLGKWGSDAVDIPRSAREAITRFLTTETDLVLDAQGQLPSVKSAQQKIHESLTRRATDPRFLKLDQSYASASEEDRGYLMELKAAMSNVSLGVPLPLNPRSTKNRVVLQNYLGISKILVRFFEAATYEAPSHEAAARTLVEWMFDSELAKWEKRQRARYVEKVLASLSEAQAVTRRNARDLFYGRVTKSLGALLLLGAASSAGMHGLSALEVLPESYSWPEQWIWIHNHFAELLKWTDLQMDDAKNLFIKTADTFGKNL